MKGTIETPKVAKVILSLLSFLFLDVVMTLEKESSNQVVFSKQLAIKKCLKDIQNFILTHPYANFNVEVLNSLTRDKEDPMLVIAFRNYTNEIPGKVPLKYHLILDETYTTFEAYQSSLDGILLKIS
jgi:hypothetical protein